MTEKEMIECMEKVLIDRIVNNTWRSKSVAKELYRMVIPEGAVVTQKETLTRLENRVAELENGIAQSMLGCEFMPECTDKILTSFILELKDKLPASMKKACAKIIFRLASEYGVDIKEHINNENDTKKG